MNEEWCFPNPATPPGSSSYYCVRFAAPQLRDDLSLVFAWHHALRDIPNRVSDSGVALTKLRWYREELQRALQGESQHPLISALVPCIRNHVLPLTHFLAMADATEADILGYAYHDLDELTGYCRQSGGNLLELITRLGDGDEQVAQCGRKLGAFVRLSEIIRDLGADLRRQRLYLPLQELERRAIPAEKLDAPEYTPALQQLLTDLTAEARSWLDAALAQQPPGPAPALGPALGYSAIALALLHETEQSGFPVLEQRLSLTPLRKLWLAWRASRRAARGRR